MPQDKQNDLMLSDNEMAMVMRNISKLPGTLGRFVKEIIVEDSLSQRDIKILVQKILIDEHPRVIQDFAVRRYMERNDLPAAYQDLALQRNVETSPKSLGEKLYGKKGKVRDMGYPGQDFNLFNLIFKGALVLAGVYLVVTGLSAGTGDSSGIREKLSSEMMVVGLVLLVIFVSEEIFKYLSAKRKKI
ncbi:MAG: hypothetical protein OEZ36_02095 [Spirochaetota bacterium]|nr:hypothetical protein [Spirochaetota bacterium]